MALYQNFTTSSSGTIIIPGPIIGTHTSNTIANIFTVSGKVGIGTTTPSGTFDVNGNISIYGNSNTLGNIFTTGGNIGIGTTTPESRFQVVLPSDVSAGWRNLTFRGTSLWGDGITTYNAAGVYTSGTLYGTLTNIMLCNPHIVSDFGSTARMRFGRAGGISTGAYWETGVKTDGSWHIGQSGVNNNFIITTGGNILLNAGTPEHFTNRFVIRDDATGTTSQLLIQGATDTRKTTHIGYDTTNNYAYLDSLHHNVAWTNTIFCRNGGNVGIATTSPSYKLHVSGDIRANNAYITSGFLYPNTSTTTATNFQINVYGGTLTINGPTNYSGYGINASGTSTIGSLVSVGGGNVGINNASPGFKLDVNGDFRAYGGRYIIQNGQDGGTGRGIYMWTEGDSHWSIYMGQSGTSRSFSGGTATTGVYGFAAHAVRFRVNNSTNNGWIFENSGEGQALSIRSDGQTYINGNLGIGQVSPSYRLHVNGDTLTNGWFRTTGDTGLWSETYSRGMRVAVTGEYGNIETHGTGKNDWEGFSIDGRYVFMSSDNNNCGIYNDVDNHWITYWDRSAATYRICHDTAKNVSIGSGGGWVQVCSGDGQFYVGGNRGGAFMKLNDDMWFSDPQNGSIEIKNGGNNNWGTLVGYFNNQCSRESKKNIIKFEEAELTNLYNDTINTDVYEFHYKEDQDTDKKKIGIILEESPHYMCVTPDGKSLYNLSYITMLHGAIKVLDKKVKALESENTTLKSQIQQIFTHLGLE